MEHVGLTERLTMCREGNAMRQWERRQRDWHRVREHMVTKTGKVSYTSHPVYQTRILFCI